jgi:hypothetical protein
VTVATFTDPGGPEPIADYAATINWGDSTGLDGGVRIVAGSKGSFIVQGRHTYARAGNYSVQVVIKHETVSATVTGKAKITAPKTRAVRAAAVAPSPSAADAVMAGYRPSLLTDLLTKLTAR